MNEHEIAQLLDYLGAYKQIELYPTENSFNINYYFKGIALFLTYGYYYRYKMTENILKLKKIEFRGLNKISAIAFLKISQKITITYYRNPMDASGKYFSVKAYPALSTFSNY